MIAWGSPEEVRARLAQHFEAGADYVAIGIIAPHSEVPDQLARLELS